MTDQTVGSVWPVTSAVSSSDWCSHWTRRKTSPVTHYFTKRCLFTWWPFRAADNKLVDIKISFLSRPSLQSFSLFSALRPSLKLDSCLKCLWASKQNSCRVWSPSSSLTFSQRQHGLLLHDADDTCVLTLFSCNIQLIMNYTGKTLRSKKTRRLSHSVGTGGQWDQSHDLDAIEGNH